MEVICRNLNVQVRWKDSSAEQSSFTVALKGNNRYELANWGNSHVTFNAYSYGTVDNVSREVQLWEISGISWLVLRLIMMEAAVVFRCVKR